MVPDVAPTATRAWRLGCNEKARWTTGLLNIRRGANPGRKEGRKMYRRTLAGPMRPLTPTEQAGFWDAIQKLSLLLGLLLTIRSLSE